MKSQRHLSLNKIKVNCITCEQQYEIFSTLKKAIKIDVCSNCHPFYLGTQKFESKAGRVERFRRLQRQTSQFSHTRKSTVAKKSPVKQIVKPVEQPKKEDK